MLNRVDSWKDIVTGTGKQVAWIKVQYEPQGRDVAGGSISLFWTVDSTIF